MCRSARGRAPRRVTRAAARAYNGQQKCSATEAGGGIRRTSTNNLACFRRTADGSSANKPRNVEQICRGIAAALNAVHKRAAKTSPPGRGFQKRLRLAGGARGGGRADGVGGG